MSRHYKYNNEWAFSKKRSVLDFVNKHNTQLKLELSLAISTNEILQDAQRKIIREASNLNDASVIRMMINSETNINKHFKNTKFTNT
jgi:hypothetical protein